jgi:hypothetical protein
MEQLRQEGILCEAFFLLLPALKSLGAKKFGQIVLFSYDLKT